MSTMDRATLIAVALSGLLASGCSDEPTAVSPVGSIEVTPPEAQLGVGAALPLSATVKDEQGNVMEGRTLVWTTSNADVATVSSTGLVTAHSLGTAQIAASAGGESGISTVTVALARVNSVVVLPNEADTRVGTAVQLRAVALDASNNELSGRAFVWTTSNATVATVDESGRVSGVSAGTVTISAASEGKIGSATVRVTSVPIASVTVSPPSASVEIGKTVQLSATVRDANNQVVNGASVTWSSSNANVAAINTSGVVTGVAAGTATITGSSGGRSGTATITVTPVGVGTVTIQPPTATLIVGQTTQLAATVRDGQGNVVSGATVVWSTNNGTVATVTNAGVVAGVSPGSATITATSGGRSGTAQITVNPVPVGSVTVEPSSVTLNPTQTRQLTATVRDGSGNVLTGRTITWTTSNALIATVSNSGLVTALLPGSATITATAQGVEGTATVTVNPFPVGSVSVDPTSATVFIGRTTQLTATVRNTQGEVMTGQAVTWSSSNSNVATVSTSGLVTGVASGTATITATSGGRSGTSAITVTPVPTGSVTVTPDVGSVIVGQTITLTATVRDIENKLISGAAVTWATSSAAIATVNNGVVTGVTPGTATITAAHGGKSGTSAITVRPVPVATVTVSPDAVTLGLGGSRQLTATPRSQSGAPLSGRTVAWSSSNPLVASVNQSGVVNALLIGTAVITANVEGVTGTANVTVQLLGGRAAPSEPAPTVGG
ncbi:MAG TPA: Ig-like domain-containing protein [Gemmatimonadaceae bacterium]|nr:Ig-like domain-containing protein [Gemmatimonadaceae bacterium]